MDHIQEKKCGPTYGHKVFNFQNGESWNITIGPDIMHGDKELQTMVRGLPIIDFDNRHFFLELSETQSGYQSWVYFSGFKEEAAKYMATIKFSEPD
jgi:hypothetical protein